MGKSFRSSNTDDGFKKIKSIDKKKKNRKNDKVKTEGYIRENNRMHQY